MDEPVIAERRPAVLKLEPETYYWCRRGRSKTQPYCDGSHSGTSFSPLEFQIQEAKQVALCQCKRTSTPPFCDGTHKKL
jgi:CDGSH-type Zn-finger protein